MKFFKYLTTVISGLFTAYSIIVLIVFFIVREEDIIWTVRDVRHNIMLFVISVLALIVSVNFPMEFYHRQTDLDAVKARYHKASENLTAAMTKINQEIKQKILEDVIDSILLPSGLRKQAKEIAKEFKDIDENKI